MLHFWHPRFCDFLLESIRFSSGRQLVFWYLPELYPLRPDYRHCCSGSKKVHSPGLNYSYFSSVAFWCLILKTQNTQWGISILADQNACFQALVWLVNLWSSHNFPVFVFWWSSWSVTFCIHNFEFMVICTNFWSIFSVLLFSCCYPFP